jgi:hypothetical protein
MPFKSNLIENNLMCKLKTQKMLFLVEVNHGSTDTTDLDLML